MSPSKIPVQERDNLLASVVADVALDAAAYRGGTKLNGKQAG